VDAEGRLCEQGDARFVARFEITQSCLRLNQGDSGRSLCNGADRFVMTLVADINDLVPAIGHSAYLMMDLGHERAHRVHDDAGPVGGRLDNLWCGTMSGQHHRCPQWHFVDVIDEHDTYILECAHYPLIVDDLVEAIDGRLKDPDHPGQRFDRHLDSGTKPPRFG
jgi:hypothetical protein